jgi:pimeloyl-ACP methyl ester carboxylesterase
MANAILPDTGGRPDVHRAVSADGTEITGRVHGQGPPIVLVHGGLGDGEDSWEPLLPYLTDQFTCYTMSTRCRGLSSQSADLSPQRLVEDVAAFAESIGEPVGLVGLSTTWTLGAAAHTDAVSAVAVYEPGVDRVLGEDDAVRIEEMYTRLDQAAAKGRLADAARELIELIANDDELATLSRTDYFETVGQNVTVHLQEIKQAAQSEQPGSTDPLVLARIAAPVLLLHGSRTPLEDWLTDSVRYVADHVSDLHVHEITDAGHLGPYCEPDAVADELVQFFETALKPA